MSELFNAGVDTCYRNLELWSQKTISKRTDYYYRGRAITLEDNVVYPLLDHMNSADFARIIVNDDIFATRDEPFYVVNISRVLAQHQSWIQNLPRVQPFYAVKCNNNKILLRVLCSLGCNFDCASKGEIESVLEAGASADRIIYANPCKTASYIKHAASRNVRMMTFDNEQELYKIMHLYPHSELVLRIAVSDPTAVCPLNLKFGCEPEIAAPALLKLAASINANVIGISFHVGSGCRDPTAFALGVSYARSLFDIGLKLGMDMRLLDLGGGFPGYSTELPFETIADVINRSLTIYFPEGQSDRVQIIAEPGRFYAASAFTLLCTVVARNRTSASRITARDEDKDDVGYMYYINDGVYGSFNCILYDHVHPTGTPLNPSSHHKAVYPSAVWGPTCDSLDLVQPNALLPELSEGSWIMYENMGAYTCAAGSEFNGFPRPPCCYIVSESDNAILHALLPNETSSLVNKSSLATFSVASVVESDDDAASVASSSFFGCSTTTSSGVELDRDASSNSLAI